MLKWSYVRLKTAYQLLCSDHLRHLNSISHISVKTIAASPSLESDVYGVLPLILLSPSAFPQQRKPLGVQVQQYLDVTAVS